MSFTLAMVQVNAHVGALTDNATRVIEAARSAKAAGADLAVFPEMVLTGYPPEDLLHKPFFLQRLAEVEEGLRQQVGTMGIDLIFGSVRLMEGRLFNVVLLIQDGQEVGLTAKWRLPNYSVFDERRYFEPARQNRPWNYRGLALGLTICEDIWHPDEPISLLARTGAELLITVNASPYHAGKQSEREAVAALRIAEQGLPMVYVNLIGGQDELVFDGGSFALDAEGRLIARSRRFQSDLNLIRVEKGGGAANRPARLLPVVEGSRIEPTPEVEAEIYQALVLGVGDYVRKNGFTGVVLGLSGGIDSALTAAICVDALGADRVEAMMMPSPFTTVVSLEDAAAVAQRLAIRLSNIAILPIMRSFAEQLAAEFAGLPEDVTEENLQARIRGVLLMAVSNKFGRLLVTTGNKSEISTGYATLYGDMAGGFAVLKDILKEMVFRLADYRNRLAESRGEPPPIPERVLTKPPSAELRANQKDSDSLPPYPVLDRILHLYVEMECSLDEMVAQGLERRVAEQVIRMVDRNEYKRRQAAPGVRVSRRAFGKDRRYPITNGFF